MYEKELKELGLTDNEIKVYLSLLQKGSLNPTQLSSTTGLHRSYIYDTLERLLEKGIVNTILINNKKNFQAVNPKVLREIFEIKLKHLDSILPQLSTIFIDNKTETNIELHKGNNVYKTMLKDLISNLKNNTETLLIGVDEEASSKIEPIFLKQYFRIANEKKIKERIIVPKGAKKLNEKFITYREIDPSFIGDKTFTLIYGNKIYLFLWGQPLHLIIIESETLYKSYKKQFEALWKISV